MSQEQDATRLVAEAQAIHDQPFDPARYLINLNGRGMYLEVKNRILWLRTEHPEAIIETALIAGGFEQGWSVFKATVSIPGGGSATGWKSEERGDFRDQMEKCETGAIGRALAALGYGTQFCDDHEYGGAQIADRFANNQHAIVDAPVTFPRDGQRPRAGVQQQGGNRSGGGGGGGDMNARATERQVKFIYAIAREAGLDEQELATWSQELYNTDVDRLTRRDASTLIEALQRRRNETQ